MRCPTGSLLNFNGNLLRRTVITLVSSFSSEQETSEQDESEKEDGEEKEVRPESLSPEELERLKEEVDDRKKLIQGLRGKPWAMKKKLVTLR